jgi:hypothetical protein
MASFAEHLTMIDQISEDIARAKTRRDRYRDPRSKHLVHKGKDQLERAEVKLLLPAMRAQQRP